jgi:hypothetical protein
MRHEYKSYRFYLGMALAAEKAREPLMAAKWLAKALTLVPQ